MVAEKTVVRRWTYSELLALNDERRVELYDGNLREMPSPTLSHQQYIGQLIMTLQPWVQQHQMGRVYVSPVDLYISETKCYIPDLMFVRRERYATERIEREDGACVLAPPDLVVEILSPSSLRYDRILKSNIYAAFGVRHYWHIDPEAAALQAFVLDNGRYAIEASLMDDDVFTPSLFPGLQIPLRELFASD